MVWLGKQHFRHLLFFAFYQAQKAAEVAWYICNVYGKVVLLQSTSWKWFVKFKNADFEVNDTLRTESTF
ncbi:hypothetical protein TNCT_559981 [Trichonephila clavata]|uniref:Mos1 transposase HTH domain-containing protein n=1 Tax=Trichonephila clavata TaxID=2740835 RepID=A0A8X6IWZ3_TRICU|nr:hypothetical protein TNCT_559981 [Trichonephila clavata]